jgi:hypothetical protein
MLRFQTRPAQEKPIRVFVHGVEKIGKTSFAAFVPKPVFLMSKGEDGLEVLISKGQLPDVPYLPVCQTWDDLLDHCATLVNEEHDRQWVVLDVCRGFERMLEEWVIREEFRGQGDAFHDFARGRKTSVPLWKDFLTGPLDALCRRGLNVLILAHSKTKNVRTPMGEDLLNYYPDSEECYWDETKKWVDQILHLTRRGLVDRKSLQKAKKFGDSEKYKNVEAAEARIVCTDQSIFYVAGGRLGLPDQVDIPTVDRPRYPWEGAEAGWAAISRAIASSREACLKAAEQWARDHAPKPLTKDEFAALLKRKGKDWGAALRAIDWNEKTTYLRDKTPFEKVDPAHITVYARWLESQPDAQVPAPAPPPPSNSPPPPAGPQSGPDEANEYDLDGDSGPDTDRETDGAEPEGPEPAEPPAEGTSPPPPAPGRAGEDIQRAILTLTHELELGWPAVRDKHAKALGLTARPDMHVSELTPQQALVLKGILEAEVRDRNSRKRPLRRPESAAV